MSTDNSPSPAPALALAPSSAIPCAGCKMLMRKQGNAWVHIHTGRVLCDDQELVIPAAKPRPYDATKPDGLRHLRKIIGELGTPMMPNTKAAVLACIDELLRVKGENDALRNACFVTLEAIKHEGYGMADAEKFIRAALTGGEPFQPNTELTGPQGPV